MRRTLNSRVTAAAVYLLLIFSVAVSHAQPPEPMLGTWKLNLAKSIHPVPPPKSMTVTVTQAAKGWTIAVDAIGADGQPQKWGYTSTFDGSEAPVVGNPAIDTARFRTTATGGVVEYKKDGKVVSTTSSVFSEDGKTMTVTAKVPAGPGNEITIVSVYDRQ